MRRNLTLLVLLLLLAWGLFSGLYGLTTRDLHAWDEGVYYDEARYLVQAARLAPGVLGGRVSGEQARERLVALPPRMGRPVNVLLNAAAIGVAGERVWAPGLVSVLAGVLCLWLTFIIMRRLSGEGPALLATFFLALCPYFLTYRRLGLPEAAATAVVLLVVWLWLKWEELEQSGSGDPSHKTDLLRSVWLGCLAGLAFGINLRVLMLVPWVLVWRSAGSGRRWWAHALAVAGGFAVMLGGYELPYVVANRVLGRFGFELESYFAQLRRFARGQESLRPEYLGSGYVDWLWMAGHYGLVVVTAAVVGVWWAWRQRDGRVLKVASLVVLPAVQAAVLIPYLRYNSWLAPVVAMLGGYGVWGLWERLWGTRELVGDNGRRGTSPRPTAEERSVAVGGAFLPSKRWLLGIAVVWLVSVGANEGVACWRTLGSKSNELAALEECRRLGATCLMTTNLSAAQAHAPVFALEVTRQMAMTPAGALADLQALTKRGRTLVVIEGHQFMNGAVMMPPEEYARSAAGLIVEQGKALWQAPHLQGMTLWLFLEHNKYLQETLATYGAYRARAVLIGVYDGSEALRILEHNVHANVKDGSNNVTVANAASTLTSRRLAGTRAERGPPGAGK
ncbi:MAG: glycosyltransferase family 39 protein [Armatimonadia bacterium]